MCDSLRSSISFSFVTIVKLTRTSMHSVFESHSKDNRHRQDILHSCYSKQYAILSEVTLLYQIYLWLPLTVIFCNVTEEFARKQSHHATHSDTKKALIWAGLPRPGLSGPALQRQTYWRRACRRFNCFKVSSDVHVSTSANSEATKSKRSQQTTHYLEVQIRTCWENICPAGLKGSTRSTIHQNVDSHSPKLLFPEKFVAPANSRKVLRFISASPTPHVPII